MSEQSELWKALKNHKKLNGVKRYSSIIDFLMKNNMTFKSLNNDTHIVLTHNSVVYDIWPTTDKYKQRNSSGRSKTGVINFLTEII